MMMYHSILFVMLPIVAFAGQNRPDPRSAGSASTAPAGPVPAHRSPEPVPAVMVSGDPAVDAILDRLEAKGKAISDLQAKITYERIETIPVEEKTVNKGIIKFRRLEPNPRLLVRFDEQSAGGIVKKDRTWYVFDGQWLITKNDKTREVNKKQLVPAGERIDPFKLGTGKFPLPFGQSRRDMLTNFSIVKGPSDAKEPNVDHLVATPKGGDLADRFKVIHFYIDRKLELPVRIRGEEKPRDGNETITQATFDDIQINRGMAAGEFELDTSGYSISVEPLADVRSPGPRK